MVAKFLNRDDSTICRPTNRILTVVSHRSGGKNTPEFVAAANGKRKPVANRGTAAKLSNYTKHQQALYDALHTYCRGAFGGPSPASLNACTTPPPRPPSPTHPHPTHTLPCPDIYMPLPSAPTQRSSCWCWARRLSNACIGDRHAPVAGCGDLGRQSP